MTEPAKSIDVSDAPEILELAEEVQRAGEPRVLRRGGEDLVVVIPVSPAKKHRRAKTAADYAAFRSAAGGWADVDTDQLIEDIYEDRRRSSRPPVDL